jgi:hypothetical protein
MPDGPTPGARQARGAGSRRSGPRSPNSAVPYGLGPPSSAERTLVKLAWSMTGRRVEEDPGDRGAAEQLPIRPGQ